MHQNTPIEDAGPGTAEPADTGRGDAGREDARIVVPLANAEATERLGADLALALELGDCVHLRGDLGAGKTTLARGLLRALAEAEIDVPSPTFTLVQAYEGRLPALHADLYRVENSNDVTELGLDEALDDGVVLVEWPERGADATPLATLVVSLEDADGGRVATISGPAADRAERSLLVRAFLELLGRGEAERRHLTGDASARSYETLPDGTERPRIVMNAPAAPDGPPVHGGRSYSAVAHLAEDVRPFVALATALRERGYHAPRVHAADMDAGLLLIENLGAGTIAEGGKPLEERYEIAADLLADLHREPWSPRLPLPDGTEHTVPPYDRGAWTVEVSLLADWYGRDVLDRELTQGERDEYEALWNDLVDRLEAEPATLVLRDFHSPNIVWRPEAEGRDRVGLIDFQDALMGPGAYDLASLAQDARVDVPADMERRLVERYCLARFPEPDADTVHAFREAYAVCALQRASKILGIFVRLDLRDNKPLYRAHLPRIRAYAERTLRHPRLTEIAGFYARVFGIGA